MAKASSFVIGDTVRIRARFKVDNVLTNPTTCTMVVQEPDLTQHSLSVTNVSTGVRQGTYTSDTEGWHRVRIEGTGTAAGVRETAFYVASSGLDD